MHSKPCMSPALIAAALVAASPSPWKVEKHDDGVVLEARNVESSKFEEIRVSAVKPLNVEAVCDAIFSPRNARKLDGDFKKRVILRESETERVVYEQIKVGMGTDRDYVVAYKMTQMPTTAGCEMQFEKVEDPRYPPQPGHVRVPLIKGQWTVQRLDDGKVKVSYVVQSEPGGEVPAMFARGPQRLAALNFFRTIVKRAEQPISVR